MARQRSRLGGYCTMVKEWALRPPHGDEASPKNLPKTWKDSPPKHKMFDCSIPTIEDVVLQTCWFYP